MNAAHRCRMPNTHGFRSKALHVVAYSAALLFVPAVVAGFSLSTKLSNVPSMTAPAYAGELPDTRIADPARKTAVVLSSAFGAEITDMLPTFDILATSGAFNVYTVAPERTVLPLTNSMSNATGLDFIPDLSYADYESQIAKAPDLIAIPYLPNYSLERDRAVVDWIRAHFGPNTTILTICAGTEVLADTGLLEGRAATTNTGWFEKLELRVPTATWVRNVRYVDDGNIISSTNLASGIDATLHTVERLVSRAAAEDTARRLGYRHLRALDDPRSPAVSSMSVVLPVALNGAFTPGQQSVGVLLYDGMDELGLAGLIDPYTISLIAHVVTTAPERTVVHSKHGVALLPRYDFRTTPPLDRVLIAAGRPEEQRQQVMANWSRVQPSRPVEDLFQNAGTSETAYDATIRDLAHHQNNILARAVGQSQYYPIDDSEFVDFGFPVTQVLGALALSLMGAGIVFALIHLPKRRLQHAVVASLMVVSLTGCMQVDSVKNTDKDLSTDQLSAHQLFHVGFSASPTPPPVDQLHTWSLRVMTPDGRPVEHAAVAVRGDMPEHGHGLPTQPRMTSEVSPGTYIVEGMKFQMGGWWVVDFDITDTDGQADTVRFNLILQ